MIEALACGFSKVHCPPPLCPINFYFFFGPFPLQELKNEVWEYSSYVMCFINDELLGDALDLQKWAHKVWDIVDFKPPALYEALTVDYSAKFLRDTKASYTNFLKRKIVESWSIYIDQALITDKTSKGNITE